LDVAVLIADGIGVVHPRRGDGSSPVRWCTEGDPSLLVG
jgi:hypothetical protein